MKRRAFPKDGRITTSGGLYIGRSPDARIVFRTASGRPVAVFCFPGPAIRRAVKRSKAGIGALLLALALLPACDGTRPTFTASDADPTADAVPADTGESPPPPDAPPPADAAPDAASPELPAEPAPADAASEPAPPDAAPDAVSPPSCAGDPAATPCSAPGATCTASCGGALHACTCDCVGSDPATRICVWTCGAGC